MASKVLDFYRELVGQASTGRTYGVSDIINRFPLTPSSIYPAFDAAKLSSVSATASELASYVKLLISEFTLYLDNGNTDTTILDTISPQAFIAFYEAKNDLGGTFGTDSNASLFASALRPITVTASATTPQQSFIYNVSTAGWNTSFFNFNTSVSSSSTPDINLYNNVVMFVAGFMDKSASIKMEELQFITPANVKEGVKSYPLLDSGRSNGLILLDESYYIGKNLKYTVDVNFTGTGAVEVAPIGIQFMNSQYYNQE